MLTILTGYRPKSREMAADASSSRLPRPWTSDGLSRYCPFVEFSRVAGVDAPAFVERPGPSPSSDRCGSGVAGVDAPAFVERSCSAALRACSTVSPGLTLRPSLSVRVVAHLRGREVDGVAGVDAPAFVERRPRWPPSAPAYWRVAGVDAPAFVERRRSTGCSSWSLPVSPGLTLRPSLSAHPIGVVFGHPAVSPGLTLRPSLSGRAGAHERAGWRV